MHVLERYSSHFVCLSLCLSVCLSVADLEDSGLLALQRDTNLNSTAIEVALIFHFIEIRPCSQEKVKKMWHSSAP